MLSPCTEQMDIDNRERPRPHSNQNLAMATEFPDAVLTDISLSQA